jgi:hypothetical protein
MEFAKRQILFTEKDSYNVNDDVSNLLLTDESKVFQELTDVGFHDILYRDVHRVIQYGFDVAFGDDVKKGEESTGTRS